MVVALYFALGSVVNWFFASYGLFPAPIWLPHDADVVLANKYGDWRDKTVLLVSLLKAANIECDPVFVHLSAPPLASEYPSLKQFNAIFVYVPSYLGKPLWVDSFADNCFFGYLADAQGGTGLEVAPDKSELLPIIETKPEENQSLCRFDVKVRPNGDVDGKFACQLTGMFDAEARSRLKDATPKEVEQYFLTSANAVGEGSKSTSYKKTNLDNLLEPVQIAQSFLTPELGVVQGDMMILRTPEVPFDFARLPSSPSQSQRNYNYVLENEISVKTEGMFTLPKGYKAVFVSNPIKIENQFGTWQSAFKLSPDSSTVQYNSSVTLVDKTIDTDEYQQFKKAFDDFVSPKNTMILLEKQLSQ